MKCIEAICMKMYGGLYEGYMGGRATAHTIKT